MIEVIIRLKGGPELGRIDIENLSYDDTEFADYSVRFGVDKNRASGIIQRAIYQFPRRKYNVLGLVLQALSTLEPEQLELHEELTDDRTPALWRKLFS